MFYILDRNGRVIGSADGRVNEQDLATRGERAVASELNLPLDQVQVLGLPTRPIIVARPAEQEATLRASPAPVARPHIVLTTSAEDSDRDGLPDLPANGRSKATLNATLYDAEDQPLKTRVTFQFRTTAGALSARSVTTDDGQATLQLTASHETVTAQVRVWAEGLEPATLALEFVPVPKE